MKQVTNLSASDDTCTANRREQETYSGLKNHFIYSVFIPGIEQMMKDVRVMESPMTIQSFGAQPMYGAKSGVLELNATEQDGIIMVLTIVIVTPRTRAPYSQQHEQLKRGLRALSNEELAYHRQTDNPAEEYSSPIQVTVVLKGVTE